MIIFVSSLRRTVPQFIRPGGSDRESIEADITGLGTLTGYTDGAEAVVADMESEWNDLSARLKKVTNEKIAFVDIGSLYSVGPGSLLDGSLSSIHVKNVAADADTTWPQFSAKKVVEANPDVYISLFADLDEVKETAGLSDLACLQNEDGFICIDGSGGSRRYDSEIRSALCRGTEAACRADLSGNRRIK